MEFRLLGSLEVCSNGQPIVLAGPKLRAILTILLLDANQVVPRSRLLADVWGAQAPGSEHSLDVHLSRLRKALAAGGAGDALTRRGRGYLLRPNSSPPESAVTSSSPSNSVPTSAVSASADLPACPACPSPPNLIDRRLVRMAALDATHIALDLHGPPWANRNIREGLKPPCS
jgi:DNA-binding winged helix-turn-helix (wHTH) protein